jgi:branched-chain amino acid transport system permease protein
MLFAASLHFMMGVGGMVSFGHAAYFGLGAYAAAILVRDLGLSMVPAMIFGPLFAGLGALVFGWFCVRLSGVYLAMLTLAAAQIVWGITFQWQDVTGGDDGILGIWPADWATSNVAFFYVALAVSVTGLALIRRIAQAPFGYVLRGGRDSPQRAEAVGIDLRAHQWLGFTLAGTFAGVAGVLFAFSKGSVFPDTLAISQSVDGLIMVLLGGVQALLGPLFGATAFVLIEDWVTRLDYWRFIFGVIILVICVAAPDGIAGGLARLWRAVRPGGPAAPKPAARETEAAA